MSVNWEVKSLELRTRHTFTIARGGADLWPSVVVEGSSKQHRGLGEGAPRAYYGESLAECRSALKSYLVEHPDADEQPPEVILAGWDGPASARAALDAALHDLWARRRGLSVTRYLAAAYGLEAGAIPPTSFTIGIDDLESIVAKTREAAAYPILKVKLGTERDLEILAAIRSVSSAILRIDANAAWSVEETRAKAPRLAEMGVELIEQPLARGDLEGYRELHGTLPLPVFADESCRDLGDVEKLVGVVDGINIKLSKCGGLWEAARMIAAARAGGLRIMVGCFVESSLGITAAAALAPYVDVLDLDGAALLAEDPYCGATIPGGQLHLPAGPGLGVAPRS